MTPPDPLAQLHPLREPELIGWWPIAPGWWLLLAVLLCLLAGGLYVLLKRYKANAYRRQGKAQLAELYQAYSEDGDLTAFATGTNALLKSVALQAFPPQQVAACTGPRWLALLNRTVVGADCFRQDFSTAIYRGDVSTLDAKALHEAATRWIARHRVPA